MDPPDVTAFTSESRSRQSSISLQRQESTLNKSIGMETHSSEHTLLSLQNRKRLSRGLSEDDPSRITVHQVLEDRFAPPFSLEDFQNFLKAEHSEENIKFYLALRKYERICSHIPVQLLQSADEVPSDLATRHDFSAAKACISSILEKFFTPGAEDELNVPANLVRDMLRNIKETNNIQPEVFKRIMENVLTMLRLSSFPNFCKLALTEGDCKPKVTVDQVLEDQLPHPMSFSDFHQFLIRERSEEKIEFYLAIKLLRATCENVPKEVLMKSSQQPPDSDYGETIKTAKMLVSDIMSNFFDPDAKYELNVPLTLKKDVVRAVRVEHSLHPDVFEEVLLNTITVMNLSSFPDFCRQIEQMEVKNGSDLKASNVQTVLSGDIELSKSSPRPSAVTSGKFPDLSVQQILDDTFYPPYSHRDFKDFLDQEHSEENIKFFLAVKEYRLICGPIPNEVLQSLSPDVVSKDVIRHINLAVNAIMEIIDTFLVPGAMLEINIPARILIPIKIDMKAGHIHPDIFNNALENVYTMLKLSSFPNFCKVAALKGVLNVKPEKDRKFANGTETSRILKSWTVTGQESDKIEILLEKLKGTLFETKGSPNVEAFFASFPEPSSEKDGKAIDDKVRLESGDIMHSEHKFGITSLLKMKTRKSGKGFDQTASLPVQHSSWAEDEDSPSRPKSVDRRTSTFTVLQVLEDKLEPPFSLADFHTFLLREHSEENFEFFMSVKDYQRLCEKVPPDALNEITTAPPGSMVHFDIERIKKFQQNMQEKFFTVGANMELNIPSKIMKPLLKQLDSKTQINSEVFDAALENVLAMLKLSSFPNFCKQALLKGEVKFRLSVDQVLENSLPSPMTRQEFYEFLKHERLELCVDFYMAIEDYDEACKSIPDHVLLTSNIKPDDESIAASLEKAKVKFSTIVERFLGEEPCLNIPAHLISAVLERLKQGDIQPTVFQIIIERIKSTVIQSSFVKFEKEVRPRPVSKDQNVGIRISQTISSTLQSSDTISHGRNTLSAFPIGNMLNVKKKSKKALNETHSMPAEFEEPDDIDEQPRSNSISYIDKDKKNLLFTVNQVLDDQLLPPFSLKDFHVFIQNEHSEENFDFYMAVKEYQRLSDNIPPEILNDSSLAYSVDLTYKMERLKEDLLKIQSKFFTIGCDTELNIPSKIRKPLLQALESKICINPTIFNDALENVVTMMRLSSFPNFCKQALMKGEAKLKPTVQQVLDNVLEAPLSKKDFYEFLLREHSEENVEFYTALKAYENLCREIPPKQLLNANELPEVAEQALRLEAAKTAVKEIIDKFFVQDGKFELNVPIKTLRPLIEKVCHHNNIHPDVFKESMEVVLTMLKLSSFPNFLKEVTKKQAFLPTINASQDVSEKGSIVLQTVQKTRPYSWMEGLGGIRSSSNGKPDVTHDETKATLLEVLEDDFLTPFSLKDYTNFMTLEGEGHSLAFYKALKEYQTQCAQIPDEQLLKSKLYKSPELSQAFFSVIQILAKYFARGAKSELHVSAEILKMLLAEVNEKRNIHPEVFKDALEYVLTTHKNTHFPKFCKIAYTKGGLKLHKKKASKASNRTSKSATKLNPLKADEDTLPSNSSTKFIESSSFAKVSTKSDLAFEPVSQTNTVAVESAPEALQVRRSSSLSKTKTSGASALDKLENEVRSSVFERKRTSNTARPTDSATIKRTSILRDGATGIKFGVLQVLEDQFCPPFGMKDFHRFLIQESSDENIDFYLAVKEHKRACEEIPDEVLCDWTRLNTAEYDIGKLEKAKFISFEIVDKFFTSGAERELNTPLHIRKPIIKSVTESNNIHPNVFTDALDNVMTMLRLSSFPNFYKNAILKGPITLKYNIHHILEDKLLSPISLKDFHTFLISEHSEENVEFFIAYKKYQQMSERLPPQVLFGRQSPESSDVKQYEQCKTAVTELVSRYVALKSPQELNVPPSIRNLVVVEVNDKKNIHPEIFKLVLENVVTTLKLASFPKFQKLNQVQIDVDESLAVKSATGVKLPMAEEMRFQMLEVNDTSSRAVISNRILSRLSLQSFNFDDTDGSNRHRIHTVWKYSSESNADPQFADMVTPAQLKFGLQQTLDDKIPPPLSCRDFRTFLKKEKKAHQVDFYLSVKRYKRMCDKVPEGLLNNPTNALKHFTVPSTSGTSPLVAAGLIMTSPAGSPTVPSTPTPYSPTSAGSTTSTSPSMPTSSLAQISFATVAGVPGSPVASAASITRIRTELLDIVTKYVEPESKTCVQLPPQMKLFLDSEIYRNGNWAPHIFDAAVQHVCMILQRSSFPTFYKSATTKAKGVKLKIVNTKLTSKGDKKGSVVQAPTQKKGEDEEMHVSLEEQARDSPAAGKLSMLLFQVLADKTSAPLSRNDFYLFLKKEHSEENFDFYMSVLNYRKMCKKGVDAEIGDVASKIIETFMLSNGQREICLTSKVKTAILKSIQVDQTYTPEIFNDALLEVLSIMRASSFPKFFEENSKDYGDDAGLHTIVPDDLTNETGLESDMAKDQDPLILQVLQNRLASPLSLADFYNYLVKKHSEKDLEFILLLEHYRKHCRDIPEFVLRNGVTVHSSRNQLHAMTLEIREMFLRDNHLKLSEAIQSQLRSKLEDDADYHPDVFDGAYVFVMERFKNTFIPAFYTQGLETEKGW